MRKYPVSHGQMHEEEVKDCRTQPSWLHKHTLSLVIEFHNNNSNIMLCILYNRQGGVLSPILFSLYMDDFLVELSELGVGCYWEGLFAGALCYADDLVLLAPSSAALHIMLHCYESFATSHSLVFNASKTQLIRFSPHSSTTCSAIIYFCN